MAYGEIREYGLFDVDGGAVDMPHKTLPEAFAAVGTLRAYHVYRDMFPMTIEALDSADIYTVVSRISWEV